MGKWTDGQKKEVESVTNQPQTQKNKAKRKKYNYSISAYTLIKGVFLLILSWAVNLLY